MIELPNPPVDLSAIFSQIETDCEAIALLEVKARLRAYTDAVGKLDGNKYQKWQHLPVKALHSLAAKLRKELEKLKTVDNPNVAPHADVPKSDDFF